MDQVLGKMMEILYEDQYVIVVLKPIGMPSQPDPTKDQDLYGLVFDHVKKDKGFESLGLIQRLDRPVGGIMVMSKTALAHKSLSNQMLAHEMGKKYLALVEGECLTQESFKDYIQKVRGNRAIVTGKKVTNSKEALLSYKRLDLREVEGKIYSLIEVELQTGRHHQIRAQMAFHHYPLVGDTKYNPTYLTINEWVDIGLYAYKLQFKHPKSNEILNFHHAVASKPFDIFKKYGENNSDMG